MKFSFPKKIKLSTARFSGLSMLTTLRRVTRYLTLIIFLGLAGWLGYTWYSAAYSYEWSDARKAEYRSEYAGEASFREERFTRTIETLKERMRLHQTSPAVGKDVFTGTSL